MTLGKRLRQLRRTAGMTMEELAEASGVSARAISDMERGHSRAPQPRTLAALATALRVGEEERRRLAEDAGALRRNTAAARPGPCEPPRAVPDFTGRASELETLRRAAADGARGGPAPVVLVHGQAGVGKTTIVLRAAEALRGDYPGGCLYLDLRGVDPVPPSAGDVAVRLLRALEIPARAVAASDEERCAQLRAVLRERRCLLILDNAADEAQVRPLLPGEGAGLVLVTCRRVLSGLEGIRRLALSPFTPEESAALLRAVADQAVTPSAAADVAEVSRLCGHLPLALRIAGTRLSTRAGWSVRHLVDRLASEDRRLASLRSGDVSVVAAFALSHAQLSPEARRVFRRLAHLPGPDFSSPLVVLVTDDTPADTVDVLDELVELGLLQPRGVDRYQLHDLLRLFAGERLRGEEPEGERTTVRLGMARRLLEITVTAGRWFEPGHGAPPGDWSGPVPLGTADEAAYWLRAEAENWLGALRIAARAGEHRRVVETAEALHWYSDTTIAWTLVGFSTGGGEITRYIGRHGTARVAQAVLVAAVPPLMVRRDDNPDGVPAEVFDGLRSGSLADRSQLYKDLADGPFFNHPTAPVSQGVRDAFWLQSMAAGHRNAYESIAAFSATDFRADLARFDVPTLVIHGDADQVVPFEVGGRASAALVRDSELLVYPDAPHGLTDTHKERLGEDLLAFLEGLGLLGSDGA